MNNTVMVLLVSMNMMTVVCLIIVSVWVTIIKKCQEKSLYKYCQRALELKEQELEIKNISLSREEGWRREQRRRQDFEGGRIVDPLRLLFERTKIVV